MVRRKVLRTTRTRLRCACAGQRGFSLLEMMVSLAILTIVIGIAVDGLTQMQRRDSAEQSKTDTVQETRDFVDQMVRDLHDVGYPPRVVFKDKPVCTGNAHISCSLIYFSPTQIKYEGDLDGTGTIYQVWMQLQVPASGKCPCILQRGVIDKATVVANPAAVPTYYTEVNGVLNSGNGAGGTTYGLSLPGPGSYTTYDTADVFDAYDVNAIPMGPCGDPTACASIDSVQIQANVASKFADPKTQTYTVYSITSKARINNAQDDSGTLSP
jgi:prepilin-type N-terminal cleavage/methylation domain-containing protein